MSRRLPVSALFAAIAASVASAGSLPEPTGTVILTVSGEIENTNANGEARFDRAMLEAVGFVHRNTHTYWTEGEQGFDGPTLEALLSAVGAHGTVIKATAINDYSITIDIAEALAEGAMLAADHNGRPMRIRDKGPLWIVYPQTAEEVPLARFNDLMIWQLKSLTVE